MRQLHILLRRLFLLGALCALALISYAYLRHRPQDLPWTDLDLAQPIGMFTGRKLAALTSDADACRALLDRAGIRYTAMKPSGSGQCRHSDAVRLQQENGAVTLSPASVAPSCPVAAALKLWEWQVVQPAAEQILGKARSDDPASRLLQLPPHLRPRRGQFQRTCDRRRDRHQRLHAGRWQAHQRRARLAG